MDLKLTDRQAMIAAGVGAALLLFWAMGRAKTGAGSSAAENIGRGAVDAAIDLAKGAGKAVVDATKGAGKSVADAIFPAAKCAKAMQEGDTLGASWHCNPATFAEWLTAGRPSACYALEDGRISCSKGWSAGGASGGW